MTHTNRCLSIIEEVEREAEHKRRCDREIRSSQIYAAATHEAVEAGITLTYELGVYRMWDERHHVAFYPITQVVMRSIIGRYRLEKIELTAECDVYDVVTLFIAGSFLK